MDGRPALGKVEDLATLAKLDDHVLLEELRARYRNNDIYVSNELVDHTDMYIW